LRTQDETKNGAGRALWRAAATLGLKRAGGKRGRRLPVVFFVTDPERTADPVRSAMALPRGCGVIFRGFGRPDAERTALAIARVARRRGLILLVGQDEHLAARVGAQGVHLPERDLRRARLIRRRHPGWLITGAVHSARALRAACGANLDAAILSTAFASRSSSARLPLGPVRLALVIQNAGLPVIALGGVNERTAKRLVQTGVSGFAAVDGLSP